MLPFSSLVQSYIHTCEYQKNLSDKTIKAYRTDLDQFCNALGSTDLSKAAIKEYIDAMHLQFKPKTVKRKIASLKAFFNYLTEEELMDNNPLLLTATKIYSHITATNRNLLHKTSTK